jgi:hypothetical protein
VYFSGVCISESNRFLALLALLASIPCNLVFHFILNSLCKLYLTNHSS